MSSDTRDIIWGKIYEVYYDSYWVEILSERLVKVWQRIDDITKFLVALTVSGSAVSGWALWNEPGFKSLWAILAGGSALLSIAHATFSVANRVKNWTEVKKQFTTLRIELESCRDLMEINPNFSIDEFENHYVRFKNRYCEMYSDINNDSILTKRMKVKSQNELNKRLGL